MEYEVVHKSKFHEREACETCPTTFKKMLVKRHHCRVCAASICSDCTVRRRLSKTDGEAYPVCVHCDFELSNNYQLELFNKVVTQREELIDQITGLLGRVEREAQALDQKRESRQKELDDENQNFLIDHEAMKQRLQHL